MIRNPLILMIGALLLFGCQKADLADLNETIYVKKQWRRYARLRSRKWCE